MNFFSFLGTCAAVPTENRDNVSILFKFGKKTFLVDVGGSPVQKLKTLKCDWMDLTGLIITHSHPDHIYGLPSLIHCLGLKNVGEPLKIYAYTNTLELVKSLLQIQFARDVNSLHVLPISISPDKICTFYSINDLKITSIPANHRIEALSLVFEWEQKTTIIYSSDTRPNHEVFKYTKCADILIHEATFLNKDIERAQKHGHSTSTEAAEFASSLGAKTLFPCHFDLHSGNSIDDYSKEIKQIFKGKVVIPDELKKYPLS
ncbi:MBL fold metallo-hydrolase [bacterium]|nr:MBL fold metallo-hydrolase [bacterium]